MYIEWNRVIVIILIVAVAGLLLWQFIPRTTQQNIAGLVSGQSRVVFVLLDLSESTRSMRGTYSADFRKILDLLQGGDRIVVSGIVANPLAQSAYAVDEKLPAYGLLDLRGNPVYGPANQKQLEDMKKDIQSKADGLLSSGVAAPATPIMDSLQLAQRVFDTYQDGKPVLIIFSDMVEVSDGYDFGAQTPLTAQDASTIIEKKETAGDLPSLKNVEVYVVGAGAGKENSDMTTEQWVGIQNFWMAYFTATGANLSADRYGAALLKF
jgi:hypothetical protein